MSHRKNVLEVILQQTEPTSWGLQLLLVLDEGTLPTCGYKVQDNPWGIVCAILFYQYEISIHVSTHRHPLARMFASVLCIWGIISQETHIGSCFGKDGVTGRTLKHGSWCLEASCSHRSPTFSSASTQLPLITGLVEWFSP